MEKYLKRCRELLKVEKKKFSVWKGNLKNTKKDGSFYYINTTISQFWWKDGKILEICCN